MRRRIRTLVVIDNLHTGGVATSLYNFIKFTQHYLKLDLLVFNEESVDYDRLPEDVTLLRPAPVLHLLGKSQKEMKAESSFFALLRGLLFIIARFINGPIARSFIWPYVRQVGDYDFCVAYAQDDGWKSLSKGCVDFILKKVSSKKKAVVIHCDYKNFGGYHPNQIRAFQQLDYIITVSKSCRCRFLECFPSLAERTVVCENFTDVKSIQIKAGAGIPYDKALINFVTVCRISAVKGLNRVVNAIQKVIVEGYHNFHWEIVGDGPELDSLSSLVSELGLDRYITLEGNKLNPYPYIKNADWFILPSLHEAAPMVFGESIALNVPILTTETCSAKELVTDRGWGIVVDNSEEGIYGGLLRILNNEEFKLETMDIDVNKSASFQLDSFMSNLTRTIL